MIKDSIHLPLPADLVATLREMALQRDEAFEDFLRGILDREVTRLRCSQASQAGYDRRVARLRTLLAPDMRRATGWADLQSGLALYGVELRAVSGVLTLHDHITGERLCSSEALGFGYPQLMHRFGGALPDELCAVSAA